VALPAAKGALPSSAPTHRVRRTDDARSSGHDVRPRPISPLRIHRTSRRSRHRNRRRMWTTVSAEPPVVVRDARAAVLGSCGTTPPRASVACPRYVSPANPTHDIVSRFDLTHAAAWSTFTNQRLGDLPPDFAHIERAHAAACAPAGNRETLRCGLSPGVRSAFGRTLGYVPPLRPVMQRRPA
jgi:hypothetical protein